MASGSGIDTNLIKCYSELIYHRCNLVEGVRIVALRNLGHLSRVMHELSLAELDDHESVVATQNKMLEDQGVEKTDTNRWLLDIATWMPWEIYICLLYAELEYYIKISKLHQPLVYIHLEEFISTHEPFVNHLRNVRHTIVHPVQGVLFKESLEQFFDDEGQTSQDPHAELMEAQHHIDDYLKWLRDVFLESISEMTSTLSGQQLFDLSCHLPQISTSLPGKSLDKMQGHSLWQTEMIALALTVPENHTIDPRAIQTPIHPELATFLPRSKTEGQLTLRRLQLPDRLQRKRSGMPEVLLRSLILFNESFTAMMRQGWSPDERRVDLAANHMQPAFETSPFFVSLALLCEPLRLYKKDSAKTQELKDADLEKRIKWDALKIFSGLRNAVFHVSEDGFDALEMMTRLHCEAERIDDYREIIGGLLTYYLSDLESP